MAFTIGSLLIFAQLKRAFLRMLDRYPEDKKLVIEASIRGRNVEVPEDIDKEGIFDLGEMMRAMDEIFTGNPMGKILLDAIVADEPGPQNPTVCILGDQRGFIGIMGFTADDVRYDPDTDTTLIDLPRILLH